MEIFKCKYLAHENEEIIGFSLNQNCQNATQYCYECLNTTHSEHFNDCIGFTKMIQFIIEFMQAQNESRIQFKEIAKQLQNCFEQIKKNRSGYQNIRKYDPTTFYLDYLQFRSQIQIIKQFYSKEKENNRCIFFDQFQQNNTQLIYSNQVQMNNIFDKIKDIVLKLHQFCSLKVIKIVEKHKLASDDQQRQNIQEAKRIVQEGIALSIHLYCFWKYQEAIEYYDKAISINPKNDAALSNKGSTLAFYNNYILLHKLQKYQDALLCFDQALSICSNPVRLKLKADSLKLLNRILKIMNQQTKMKLNNFIWLH